MRNLVRFRTLTFLALLCFVPALMPAATQAQIAVGVAIHVGPPALPVYEQPPCPEEGYLWQPGYWAYGPAGYYWVPGVWVAPPQVGLLWTPGYWGFAGGAYAWHPGYWGPHVGFYGGINYGFGYGGVGFVGGAWRGGVFAYNTAVWHAGPGFRNVYVDRTVVHETVVNRYSFNGEGGVRAYPTAQERGYMNEHHFQPTAEQRSHEHMAGEDHRNWASENHGRPVGMGVNARQERQQDRIAQGVHSGQMTPHETAHVEHQEAAIHHEVHNDREANGGHLTPQEHHQVEHQQNHESKEIYRDKHNDRKDK
jgi:WXXGXW repeat (2 copies)